MRKAENKILYSAISLVMSVQLIFSLSGFIFDVNAAECCHTRKIIVTTHSCCGNEINIVPQKCHSESSAPVSNLRSNCGCIHAQAAGNPDFTVYNSFELQKANSVSFFYPSVKFEYTLLNYQTKKKIEKEHGPPLFLLDATFLI